MRATHTLAVAAGQRLSGEDLLPGELSRPGPEQSRSPRVAECVAAARRIVEEQGTGALTMRRLADELSIRAPSLYKHFANKAMLESALIEDALFDIGTVTHDALHEAGPEGALQRLLGVYRGYCVAHENLYRLATGGPLDRASLPDGLEEWAGNPWFVVTGNPSSAQALWSFAHGMVILEIDGRYPPGSDLDATWRAGGAAFALARTPSTATQIGLSGADQQRPGRLRGDR